jgi:hypothetical protein
LSGFECCKSVNCGEVNHWFVSLFCFVVKVKMRFVSHSAIVFGVLCSGVGLGVADRVRKEAKRWRIWREVLQVEGVRKAQEQGMAQRSGTIFGSDSLAARMPGALPSNG